MARMIETLNVTFFALVVGAAARWYNPAIMASPRILLAGLLTLGLQHPAAAQYTWKPVRIVTGGYIPGLVAHPTEPGLIYARTDIGSVYRWNPATREWIPLTDFQAPARYNLNGPESIALDPTDPDRLYIAAGMYTCSGCPFAFLVSTDRGASFTSYSAPFAMGANNDGRAAGERLAVNPFNPSQLLMGTRTRGLWKSEDRAQTWTQVAGFPITSSTDGFGIQWVRFDPRNSGTVYVGSYTNASIYRSTDGGASWAALPGQPAWPFSTPAGTHPPAPGRAVLNPDGNLYVTYGDLPGPNTMNYGLVEKFNPAMNEWTNITPPLDTAGGQNSPRGGFCGISQDPTRPGTIAVSTFNRWYPVDTIYLTHDGGNTWTDLGRTTSAAGFTGLNAGNYYFNPSVFSALAPWLTFGNTSTPRGSAKFGWWISALLIDPTSPDHLMFATGATVYATDNLSAADGGRAPSWYVQGLGIEETAVLALISPSEGSHLLSGVGDIGGFRHDRFDVSPAAGMYTNPVATTTGSMDWAGQSPLVVVRAQAPSGASTSPCTWGAFSADGGTSWKPFPTCAAGTNSGNGGPIAVDASGAMLMWTAASGSANRPQYSTDGGATWNATAGLPGRFAAVADKVAPRRFYAYSSGAFFSTADNGGTVFTAVNSSPLPPNGSCNGSGCGVVAANFALAGDLWLPLGSNGLFHSTDAGVTWTKLLNVSWANSVAVGAPAPRHQIQSVFLYGTASPANVMAIYRSDNNGASWIRINDDDHQYGGPTLIQADPRVFGRVYLGMNGRGIIYGDIARPLASSPSIRLK
jgi:oligoxyloglucan reducing-end-specific cellobiohydrolase